jgi:hypothetical protein
MQIERLSHLQFPPNAVAVKNDGDDAQASGAARQGQRAPVPTSVAPASVPVPPVVSSVVLKIQSDSAAASAESAAQSPVYAAPAKVLPVLTETVPTQAMAQAHQLALQRNAGKVTEVRVDKDGILVARQQPAAASDFVSFAVSTMRDFANEAERVKQLEQSTTATLAQAATNKLRGLQQFAARLNLFG